MICPDTGQDGWHAQTQTQRSCSEWLERSLFSGPNLMWVCSSGLWMPPFVAAHILYCMHPVFSLYCRTSSERSRTLWWWMRSITCHSSPLTARAKWARWVNKRQTQCCSGSGIVSHLKSSTLCNYCMCFFLCALSLFVFITILKLCYFTHFFSSHSTVSLVWP